MSPFLFLSLAALAFAVGEMTVTWLLARRWSNYGIVDVVWSGGFAVIAVLYWALSASREYHPLSNGFPGWNPIPSGVLTFMVTVWSLRLAWHLGRRVASHHPVEDVRYARLRAAWGVHADQRMYGFFLVQGLLQVVLSLPFLVTCLGRQAGPTSSPLAGFQILSILLWVGSLVGESVADGQLARFRSNPSNRGKVCQDGLWSWSRHPNYFFEWLIWVAYALFAIGYPGGWTSIVAPGLILYFLLKVTGIPMTEALSVESKGDAYRQYQRTTSAFVPWPPRTAPTKEP
jgi:steroid 5-alpha reductase family enzyme